tara:strand:- start:212 stop:892 length:681 start_codon:yes stop_codon:yes gene_type:complete
MYEELDIVDEMSSAAAPEFQKYYEEFCRRYDVDIGALNQKHAQRIQDLYGVSDETPLDDIAALPYSGSTDMVPHQADREPCHTYMGEGYSGETVDTADDKEMYDLFSKLFKKLAIRLHPDKLNLMDLTEEEKDGMLNMFTKAKTALEERRYFILIDYAEKLRIALPKNYKQQTRWMKKELEIMRGKIGGQMRSYNYMFAETDTMEEKDLLIRQFLQHLFDVTIPQE